MTVIVTDTGFAADTWADDVVELGSDIAPEDLAAVAKQARRIRIRISGYADGRGFTLARRLRMLGYTGMLRAAGPLVADQYAMARRAGFDDVEVSAETAQRQPWDQWQFRADWKAHDYQARLRGLA